MCIDDTKVDSLMNTLEMLNWFFPQIRGALDISHVMGMNEDCRHNMMCFSSVLSSLFSDSLFHGTDDSLALLRHLSIWIERIQILLF